METLFSTYNRKLRLVNLKFKRFIYDKIDWDERLICIKGQRGVGKTTLILQHIKEAFPQPEKALYVSLDNLWFATNSLRDLVEYHYTHGGTHIFLDEVHKYKDWQTAIKNIYDDYPDLSIVYTGSSMLKIDSSLGDLSRRQGSYTLPGLSFREFLQLEGILDMPAITLEELIGTHQALAGDITSRIKILPAFEQYLRHGYYPFYREAKSTFDQRLQDVCRQVIESDIPAVEDMSQSTLSKIKRLLMILAEKVPYQPNMTELYRELETNREQGLKMLDALQRAGLIAMISYEPQNLRTLSKPDKILLDNTNLVHSLTGFGDKGTVRETFFSNQMRYVTSLALDRAGDFRLDRRHVFEVGGRKKGFNQIKDLPDSYVAADDLEIGFGNKIPLWMFGFLY
jgi:hypothetical protein